MNVAGIVWEVLGSEQMQREPSIYALQNLTENLDL